MAEPMLRGPMIGGHTKHLRTIFFASRGWGRLLCSEAIDHAKIRDYKLEPQVKMIKIRNS